MEQTVYTGGHMIGAFLNTDAGILPLKSFWLTLLFFGGFKYSSQGFATAERSR